MSTQTALRFAQKGALKEVLSIQSIPIPSIQQGQSLVHIYASAINPSDVMNIEGKFAQTTLPRTPGRDFAGVVVDGPKAQQGTRVWGTGGSNGFERDGAHAEHIVVTSDELAQMPANLSFSQAAACGVGFLTASTMLRKSGVGKGDFVLVLGSSGAVGSSAVQLAHLQGAIPLETSRKPASGMINITDDLPPQVKEATSGKGIAAVIDTVGDAALFKKSLEALGPDGTYVIISVARTPSAEFTFNAFDFYRARKSLIGINSLPIDFATASKVLGELKQGFEDGLLKAPALLEETDLSDEKGVVEAYEKVKKGSKAKQILVNKNVEG